MPGMLALSLLALVAVDDPLVVRWEVPAGVCASPAEVSNKLRIRLGPRLYERGRVEVVGTVTSHEDGLHLQLHVEVDDEASDRELEARSCEELLDAVVLITSLTVGGEDPEPPVPDEPVPDEPVPDEQSEPTPRPMPSVELPNDGGVPSLDLQGSARVGAGAAWGQVPALGAWFTAGGDLHGRRWVARVDLSYALPRIALLPGFDDRGAVVQAWYVSLDGGLRLPLGTRVHVPITLGFDVGAVHGRGFGVETTNRQAQPWVAPALGVGVDLRLTPRVGLWLAGRLGVPLARPAFDIEGRGTVFRSKGVSPRAAAGVMIMFE